jgi:hypothetical protein
MLNENSAAYYAAISAPIRYAKDLSYGEKLLYI